MTTFKRLDDEDVEHEYDWSKPSLAVVAANNGDGVVLHFVGGHIDYLVSTAGTHRLDGIGLDDAPDGISIWEGKVRASQTHTPDGHEHDEWAEGTFRAPTAEEWAAIQRGECPWDEKAWDLPAGEGAR